MSAHRDHGDRPATIAALLLALAGCSFRPSGRATDADLDAVPGAEAKSDATVDPTPWLEPYAYRKAIVVTAGVALEKFPVSLVEGSDKDLGMHLQSEVGDDLAFTAADGITKLANESRAGFGTGQLEAWVEATLAATPTTIYLYYGSTQPIPSTAVMWSGYAGVWHADNSPAPDSTTHHNDATAVQPERPPVVDTGIVGGGLAYDGATEAQETASPPDASLDFGRGSLTYELWVDVTTSAGPFDIPIHKGGSSQFDPGYDMELGSGQWNAEVADATGTVLTPTFGMESAFLGRWVHLAAVLDRTAGTFTAYADGLPTATVAVGALGSVTGTEPLAIGYDEFPFQGLLDEVRVIGRALPPEWIAAEHANLASRASFTVFGREQPHP